MDPLRHLTAECGFFTTQQAKAAGCADRDIARLARQRVWIRFRRGYYAFADEWDALDDVGRHLVRCSAVMHSLGDSVALSHVSGLAWHEIDVWNVPLDRVHVTRLDGGPGRMEGDVVHHEGVALDADVVRVNGRQVMTPARCAVEAGSRTDNATALCFFDAGIRVGAFTDVELFEQFGAMQHWPYVRHLHIPVRMADGRSGSIGESRGRWIFHCLGIPTPVLQHEVRTPDGTLIGTTDWWWEEHGLLGEFDGRIKYGRLLKPGQDAGAVVFAEKRREDELREATGARMIRFVWSDYAAPRTMRQRFDRIIGAA